MKGPYIRSVCCMILAAFLIFQTISFATTDRGPTVFGPYLGADFAVFYVAGSIFNSYHPEKIYDVELHTQLYRGLFPRVPPEGKLPYANAPFFVFPFALLARLPYQWAYLLWMLISCGLYLGGLKVLRGTFDALPADDWRTALFLALSFAPFLFEGVAGGQVSVFGFFWLALTLSLERRGRNLAAGAALAFLAYKPTLLVLILPMLIITRRRSLLCGFSIGMAGLAFLSLLAVGWQGCHNYLKMLLLFLHTSTGAESVLRTWKYVDINSFSRLLAGEQIWGRWAIVLLAAGAMLPLLFRVWNKSDWERENKQALIWAITIAWTLVLNVYLAIYDTILIVISVLIAIDFLDRKGLQNASGFRYLLVLLYLIPWVSQPVARWTGIQLYTLALVVFGFYLISLFGKGSSAANNCAEVKPLDVRVVDGA